MLLVEEFGSESLDSGAQPPASPFPQPTLGPPPAQDPDSVAASGPSGAALDVFLGQSGISPFPTRLSNVSDENPWRSEIEAFLGRSLVAAPAEGRPPGEGWAHQRYEEFPPQVFFVTAQAGARVNGGVRDGKQNHHYAVGEFGPGGLYHNTAGRPETEGTTRGIEVRFHPNMPVQNHASIWTFDGTLPPKLIVARVGQPFLMRHYNALPIDPAVNGGFGLHTITTHEHNGHTPAESDGFTNAFFFPGEFYDYVYPMQLAGYDSINTAASDPRAAFPCSPGETLYVNDANPGVKTCTNGSIRIRGDWRETMSSHWFHDHMLGFTATNVYKGNVGKMNIYSALDRGNEAFDDGVNLRFPSGTALSWGNRDYDVNLVVADKAWGKDGQLTFNIFNTDGFLGDQVLTNWLWHPYFNVRARSYRFRILNGAVSRYFALALVQQIRGTAGELPGPPGSGVSYNRVPFYMIANDGNIMEHAIPFDGSVDLDGNGNALEHKGQLPVMGIGERYDIIVDFSKNGIKPGDRLYLVNDQEHENGKVVGNRVPLGQILSGQYKGDPTVGRFLEFRVVSYSGKDLSMNPADYVPGKKAMIPLTLHFDDPIDQANIATAVHHTFLFGRGSGTDQKPWTIETDGGQGFTMDPARISAAVPLATDATPAGFNGEGTLQVWKIALSGGGWSHPVHVHFEEGIILRRDNKPPPEWEKWARKDMYRIGPEQDSSQSVDMAFHVREFAGTYMEHCHNTQHEDHSMLLRWDSEHPGQIKLMPAPMPTWDGVGFVDSKALPKFRTGDGVGLTANGE